MVPDARRRGECPRHGQAPLNWQPVPGSKAALIPPRVVHESIAGEVVLIDLDTGSYYSLDGLGAEIWAQLVAGADPAVMVERIGAGHGLEAGEARRIVDHVLRELEDEHLVELAEDHRPARNGAPGRPATSEAALVPRLRKYTDMQDLLLLDPIHEIDQSGWPNSADPG